MPAVFYGTMIVLALYNSGRGRAGWHEKRGFVKAMILAAAGLVNRLFGAVTGSFLPA